MRRTVPLWLLSGCFVITGDDLRRHDAELEPPPGDADTDTDADSDTDSDADADTAQPDDDTAPPDGDDDPTTATTSVLGEELCFTNRWIDAPGDVDWFEVRGLAYGRMIQARVDTAYQLPAGPLDPRLEVRRTIDQPGFLIDAPPLTPFGSEPLVALAALGPSVWLGVTSASGAGSPDHDYLLCVEPVATTEVEPNDAPEDSGVTRSSFAETTLGTGPTRLLAAGALSGATDVDRFVFDPRPGFVHHLALDPAIDLAGATLVLQDLTGAELARSVPGDPQLAWPAVDDLGLQVVVTGTPTTTPAPYAVWLAVEVTPTDTGTP